MALVKQANLGEAQLSGTAEPPDEDYAGPQTPPRHSISFAASLAGGGLISYLACVWIICTSNLDDRGMAEKFSREVDDIAYQWPMIAFGTAFALNSVTLGFERESSKFQLALLACYINLIAFINDYLAWQGTLPIVKDVWGHGLHLGRHVMWLHATPAMVYLLSIISDFSRDRVTVAMAVDVCMLSLAILAHLTEDKLTSVLAFMGTFCCFFYVVNSLWSMFDAPLATAHNDASTMSLKVLRFTTVGLWYMFPSIWTLARCGLLSINMQEWLWTCCDFMGKVMFSSSLLEGNFLSIEARRLIAMRIVEEGNRVQVIQELKELVEQKERFMSGMSHELRTPLNGIIGLSEALVMGSCGQINDAAIKTISTIKTSGARLLNLINDILDAASMRQMKGQLTIKQEKVVLSRIVRDVIDLCQPLAKRGVKLVGNLPENIPPVLGDTGRLIQIFHNLIGNSCKFTHTGTISITATHKMDEVEVAVSDSGIGIPEEKFSTVFLAFEQVDMSTTRKYGGTGLGLNLVKQLVEAHGGRIEVRSKLGVGTTFFFSLPVWDDSLAEDGDGLSSSGLLTPGSAARRKSMSGTGGKLVIRSHSSEGRGLMITSSALPPSSSRKGNAPPPVKRSSFRASTSSMGQPPRVKHVSHDSSPSYAPQQDVGKSRSDSDKASGSGTPTQEAGLGLGHKTGANVGAGTGAGTSEPRQNRKGYDASNVTGPLPLDDAMLLASVVKRRAGSLQGLRTAASGAAKIHVLSVDDDPTNQMVIQSLLGGDKYQITQAMTGQEALDVLAEMEELPDVILLDVMMPGMSGYETCCQIRETYPLSCVPIIMISAKGKEENIVEGLRSGSNDYVIKPFGRQEILARITAHLRFRDETYTAGEIAASDSDGAPSASACLAPLMDIQGYGTSLPQGLATALESGQGNNVQVYKQLTMLSVELVNHQAWAARCPVDEVVAAMTRFHIQLDQALQTHGGYCVDDPAQAHLTILTGLKGEADQVSRALNIMVALLDEVEGDGQQPDEMRLVLAGSLHMLPAQGVVVGTSHPVMQLTGQLPADSANLLAMAPPGNVLITSHAHEALEPADKAQLVAAAEWRGSTTYLLPRRDVDSHIQFVSAEAPKMSNLPSQVATNACRLQPVQRSMMELVRVSPMHMFELGNTTLAAAMGKAGTSETSSRAAQHLLQTMASYNASLGGPSPSTANPATASGRSPLGGTPSAGPASGAATTASVGASADVGAGSASGAGSVEGREIDKLLHSNAMLTRQLDETAQEVERLALEVESLTEQLAAARASVAATSGAARDTGASGRLAVGRSQLPKETDGDLSAALARVSDLEMELATAKAEAAIAERRLVAMQDAMVRAYEAYTMPMSTAPPSPPSTQPMGLMYAHTASSMLERRQGQSMSAGGNLVSSQAGRATSEFRLRIGGNDDALPRSPRSLNQVKRAASAAGDFTPQLVLPPEAFDDITVLLEELGLQELLPRFQDEQITPDVLPHLSEDALRDLGVTTLGARLKIRLAAAALANN